MEILFVFGVAVAFLVTFDLLALRFGADSRKGIGDDRHRPRTPSWF
ncbi:MAG: hypothetical protein AB1736_12070 [Chloroflexota bacterium]